MIRAKLIAEGKVQRVGYREKVQEVARELNIVGKVRNLKSGNVEIICEGEKQDVENFIKVIEIKDELIDVKKITRTFEEATGEFEHFEIEYGDIREELTEGLGAGRRELIALRVSVDNGFSQTNSNFKVLGDKIDSGFSRMDSNFQTLGDKIDTGFSKMDSNFQTLGEKVDSVGDKIDSGFSKTDSNFQTLGEKIDAVGKNVAGVGEKIDAGFSQTTSNFKDLDGKYDVVSRELKSINENISKLVTYLGALVEEFVKKKKRKSRAAGRRR